METCHKLPFCLLFYMITKPTKEVLSGLKYYTVMFCSIKILIVCRQKILRMPIRSHDTKLLLFYFSVQDIASFVADLFKQCVGHNIYCATLEIDH